MSSVLVLAGCGWSGTEWHLLPRQVGIRGLDSGMDGRPVNDDINPPFPEPTLRSISSRAVATDAPGKPAPIPLTPSVAHRPPSTTHYTTITIPVTIVAQSPHPSHGALVTKISDTLFTEGNKKDRKKKKKRTQSVRKAGLPPSQGVRTSRAGRLFPATAAPGRPISRPALGLQHGCRKHRPSPPAYCAGRVLEGMPGVTRRDDCACRAGSRIKGDERFLGTPFGPGRKQHTGRRGSPSSVSARPWPQVQVYSTQKRPCSGVRGNFVNSLPLVHTLYHTGQQKPT